VEADNALDAIVKKEIKRNFTRIPLQKKTHSQSLSRHLPMIYSVNSPLYRTFLVTVGGGYKPPKIRGEKVKTDKDKPVHND